MRNRRLLIGEISEGLRAWLKNAKMDGKNAVNPEISDRGNETIVQQGEEGSSQRTIEKGEFRDNIEHNFHDATKAWRKQINYLQSQLVNNIDISTLQNESRTLEQCMDNLTQAHDALEMVSESTVEKIILYGKFEDMSRENNNVLKQVHQTIRDLKADLNDRGSVTSKRTNRSGSSRKTGRSLGSRYSRGSTNSSTRQRRQELEEEAAILKAKMRLVHEKEELDKANQQALEEIEERVLEIQREEKKVKEQIKISEEKFKMREDLAETEARIEVCTKFDCDDGHPVLLWPPVLVPPSCPLRSTAPRILKYLPRTSTPTHLISFPLPVVPNQTQWKTALQITAFRTIARPQLTLRQTQKVQPCSKQSPSCLRPKTRIDYPYPLQEFSTATH